MNSNAKSPALESGAAANAALPALHFQFLDGARGVAILAVLLFHCIGVSFGRDQLPWNGWLRDFSASRSLLALLPISYGWVGVPIFFVVSGFCIHWSFLKSTPRIEGDAQPSKIHSKIQWRNFFLRRFFRIYPPYLLTLLFFSSVFPITRLAFESRADWAQFLSHLLLVHNFHGRSATAINPSYWSIAVEVQLYLLYPLLLLLVRRTGWKRALLLLAALEFVLHAWAGGWRVLISEHVPRLIITGPLAYWFSWSIGAYLADAMARRQPLPFRSLRPWPLLAAAIATFAIKPLLWFSFPLFALLTASIFARYLSQSTPNHDATSKPVEAQRSNPLLITQQTRSPFGAWLASGLRALGLWSYSIYSKQRDIGYT